MSKEGLAFIALGLGLAMLGSVSSAQNTTDPSHDIFVENSTTHFTLTAQSPHASGKYSIAFELSVPDPGDYTLACFIDGKLLKPIKFKSPGTFELSHTRPASRLLSDYFAIDRLSGSRRQGYPNP